MQKVYRIDNKTVRLIIPPGVTLLDDMKWLRFVLCTPCAECREVNVKPAPVNEQCIFTPRGLEEAS